jgi:hypothetical protein
MIKAIVLRCGALLMTVIASSSVASAQEVGKAEIHNQVASGNLESLHKLGCIPLTKASPEYNPVDLYRGQKSAWMPDACKMRSHWSVWQMCTVASTCFALLTRQPIKPLLWHGWKSFLRRLTL